MIERPAAVDEAIILSWTVEAEGDKRVSLFTRRGGRQTLIARGALKPMSRSGGSLEPAVRIAFLPRRAGARSLLTQVRPLEAHLALRSDPAAVRRALVVLEILQRVPPEGKAAPDWWQAACLAVSRLDGLARRGDGLRFYDAVLDRFKLDILHLEGMGFDPALCEECGREDENCRLTGLGQIRCPQCAGAAEGMSVGWLRPVVARLGGRDPQSRRLPGPRGMAGLRRILQQVFSARTGVELRAESSAALSEILPAC